MANQDIIPFASPHGGHSVMTPIGIAASTTFNTAETSWLKGEVCLVASGKIGAAQAVIRDGAADGPHVPATMFIAVESSQGAMSLPGIASGAATINWVAPFIPVLGEQEFMTRNVYTNSDTRVAPTAAMAHVEVCGWWRDNTPSTAAPNGSMGIDTNGTGLIITRVLDANMVDVALSGGTGVWAVFKANGE